MTLGKSLERMRKDRGLSFKRLGKLTGLSTATLWDIEQDKKSPTVKTCMQIAKAYDIPLFELFAYVNEV